MLILLKCTGTNQKKGEINPERSSRLHEVSQGDAKNPGLQVKTRNLLLF